jgi:hypothetical protein
MRTVILSAALAALCLPMWAAQDQSKQDASKQDQSKDVNADDIMRKFAAKEAEFKVARGNYTYRQTVKLEELDYGGNPTGHQWEEIDDIIFTPDGRRMEKPVYAPVQNLQQIILTPEDVQDLREVQPFVLTTTDIGLYSVNYLGREKIDEIGCYTFSVKPKKMEKGKRYFEGEIWVDDRDLQIVKSYGKAVGIVAKGNEFPKFETYREQIDGKYWFPTYTHADDTLHFPNGQNVHIRMTVKYQDYKKFEGKSTITYGKPVDDTTKKKQ